MLHKISANNDCIVKVVMINLFKSTRIYSFDSWLCENMY